MHTTPPSASTIEPASSVNSPEPLQITTSYLKGASLRLYGFVEADSIYDTTQSLTEEPDNNLIQKRSSILGQRSREEFSERNSRLGLVPIGYADGYPREYSNKASMLVDGRLAPVVGRVSMDLTVIDLTDIPSARPGDEVIVLDSDPLSPVSAYRLADWAATIPYEVFCRIGSRVKRVSLEPVEAIAAQRQMPSDLLE